jgi:hypothetical protein
MFSLEELLFILVIQFSNIRGTGGERKTERDWNVLDDSESIIDEIESHNPTE